jgi:hypothetical protein
VLDFVHPRRADGWLGGEGGNAGWDKALDVLGVHSLEIAAWRDTPQPLCRWSHHGGRRGDGRGVSLCLVSWLTNNSAVLEHTLAGLTSSHVDDAIVCHRKRATTAASFNKHFARALLIVPTPAWREKALTPNSGVYC